MTSKYARGYRRQQRAEAAKQISSLDREMLDLMGSCGSQIAILRNP
ncbi:hypothetical protein [Bradyrhizobium sp. dw_78]|nr:hypothetical protein [Bradyrhizobium sp. dw_78]